MSLYFDNYSTKLVSVIIPNHNYGRYLDKAINSVLAQTYTNVEIIVIDNGSSDNSIEVLESFGNRIKFVRQVNRGQANARNLGLSLAHGEYLAFLDADDYWEPLKLEQQIKLLSRKCQLVYCSVRHFDSKSNRTLHIEPAKFRGDLREADLVLPATSIVISGESTAVFTREVYSSAGFLDERLNSSAGWEFFLRIFQRTEIDFVPEALVNYRIHETNMSKNYPKVVEEVRKLYFLLESQADFSKKRGYRVARIKLEFSFLKGFSRSRDLRALILSLAKLSSLFRGLLLGNYKSII